ncbi:hypothetical protein FQA39_LY03046 [Lamprigera yunnana]|nr:hypothetical protein FQA39_LY03046 [Lamprigera yunnana]
MVLSMDRWIGKIAIVTGASAGIGSAIVVQLVQHGVKVVGLARRKDKMDELAKSLEGMSGKFYSLKADVSKEEDILDSFRWVKENLGQVSILINNAGFKKDTNLIDGCTQLWKATIDTNVIGLCIATREAVQDMTTNGIDGHIIHIGSTASYKVSPNLISNVYPATKFAIRALTETLRLELKANGSKIKISCISPGATNTEFREDLKKDVELYKGLPMLKAGDVADAVVYILSTPPHVQVHDIIINPQ